MDVPDGVLIVVIDAHSRPCLPVVAAAEGRDRPACDARTCSSGSRATASSHTRLIVATASANSSDHPTGCCEPLKTMSHEHALGASCGQPVDDLRMAASRPRPAVRLCAATVVDRTKTMSPLAVCLWKLLRQRAACPRRSRRSRSGRKSARPPPSTEAVSTATLRACGLRSASRTIRSVFRESDVPNKG